MSKCTNIIDFCGDYSFEVEYSENNKFRMFFNSRRNAETVKRCIEVDDSVPNVATAVDFVEVVRCKDCKHYGGVTYGFVCRKYSGAETKVCTEKDHYCSYGERRERGMKQRLMELLNDYCIDVDIGSWEKETLADYLLNSGVIVLPCKVGQWVYVPWEWCGQKGIASVKVEEIKFYDEQMHCMFFIDMESDDESFNQAYGGWVIGDCIGKTVFLTREKAEKALAERGER